PKHPGLLYVGAAPPLVTGASVSVDNSGRIDLYWLQVGTVPHMCNVVRDRERAAWPSHALNHCATGGLVLTGTIFSLHGDLCKPVTLRVTGWRPSTLAKDVARWQVEPLTLELHAV